MKFQYKLSKLKWELADLKKMHSLLLENKPISIFNAQKSCYIKVDDNVIGKLIRYLSKVQLESKIRKKELEIINYKMENNI